MVTLCIDVHCVLTGPEWHLTMCIDATVYSQDPSGMLALCIDAHCMLIGPKSHVCVVFVIHSAWLR